MSTKNIDNRNIRHCTIPIRIVVTIVCLLGLTSHAAMSITPAYSPVPDSSIPDPAAYDIEEIPSLEGNLSIAYGINNSGQVAGFSLNAPGCCAQAFRFSPPNNTEFWSYPPITYGHAINDAGIVAGEQDISGGGGGYWAFMSSGPSNITPLGPMAGPLPGYTHSQGLAINRANEVAADAYFGTSRRAVLFSNGQVVDLGTLGENSFARGVNDSTEVVGYSEPPGFVSRDPNWDVGHAFVWRQSSGMLDLNDPNPQRVRLLNVGTFVLQKATAINDHHQIVGFASSSTQNVIRAYLLTRRRLSPLIYEFIDLGTFPNGGGISYALALNRAGAAVGGAYEDATGAGNVRATLFTHNRVINLHSELGLLDRLHWLPIEATGINDNGEIVGWGFHDGLLRAFKLTPRAHITVGVDPPLAGHPHSALVSVSGRGFSPNKMVEVEIHEGDIGGALLARRQVTTDRIGSFALSRYITCGIEVAVSAWDHDTGVYSNAGTIQVPCFQ